MIDKNQAYCLSGALSPLLIGYSVSSIKDGALPLGLIVGGVAVITTPFVLKYLTPFAMQYAEMLSLYFYPPSNPPPSGPLTPPVVPFSTTLTPNGSSEKLTTAVKKAVFGESSQNKVNDNSSPYALKTPKRQRRNSVADLNTPDSLERPPSRSLVKARSVRSSNSNTDPGVLLTRSEFSLPKQLSLGDKRLSVGTAGYVTPPTIPSSFNSPNQSPVNLFPEGRCETLVDYMRSLNKDWQGNRDDIDSTDLFYWNLSLGTVLYLKDGTSLVKGIPNESYKINNYVIAALQAISHNNYFFDQLKDLNFAESPDTGNFNRKKLLYYLNSLFKSFIGKSETDQMEYKMKQIKEYTQKIKKFEFNHAVGFIDSLFLSLNINNFTLIKSNSSKGSFEKLRVLQVPATESTLVSNINLFFSNQTVLQGPLPDLFTIELCRVDEDGLRITKEIDIEEEIDFSPYLKDASETKSLYKIKAAICFLEEDERRYVTFVHSEGKWLLCDEDEISEVTKPYFKGADAFVFERVD